MKNNALAAIFYEMADILEMQNVQWKPRAYKQAARAIENLSSDVSSIFKKGGLKALEEIPGVGEGIGKKIIEFIQTGKIKEYDTLMKQVPSHIDVLVRIPGMGPKKVKKLNELLKISTVKQLEKACLDHKVSSLPGFGKESEQDILEGIYLMKKSKRRILLREAEAIAQKIISLLKKNRAVLKITTAGSLRRRRPTIGDIDILVSSKKSRSVVDSFVKQKGIEKVLGKGDTKATIVLKSGVQVDLRVVPPESWGAASLYFIGSKNYNIDMRKVAIKKGYKLSEYGLYDKKTGKMIAGRNEKAICKILGLKWLKPEDRER